ncbi:MAG: hypothetical protein ACJAS1_004171 [Oleiphilaceae bacterium]|jgi:hypothetical protein
MNRWRNCNDSAVAEIFYNRLNRHAYTEGVSPAKCEDR